MFESLSRGIDKSLFPSINSAMLRQPLIPRDDTALQLIRSIRDSLPDLKKPEPWLIVVQDSHGVERFSFDRVIGEPRFQDCMIERFGFAKDVPGARVYFRVLGRIPRWGLSGTLRGECNDKRFVLFNACFKGSGWVETGCYELEFEAESKDGVNSPLITCSCCC